MFFDNFKEKIEHFIKKQPKEILSAIKEVEHIFYSENLAFDDERIIALISNNPLIKKDDYGVTLDLENKITLKYYWGDGSYFEKLYLFNSLEEPVVSFFIFCDIPAQKETIQEIDFAIKHYGSNVTISYDLNKKTLDYETYSIEDYNEYKFIFDNFEHSEINEILPLFFDFKLDEKQHLYFFHNILNSFKKTITYDKSQSVINKSNSI